MSLHPVGFEPTPPERLGLKSNAFLALLLLKKDQLGHGYKSLSSLLSGATEQLVRLSSRKSHLEGHRKERTRPRYLEDGGVGRRRRPGDQRSRHRCRGDERACACGHRREGVVDLHGVPQGVADALLRPQRCVYAALLSHCNYSYVEGAGFCRLVKRLPPALQRLLEDHRDNYRHPRPAERGRSAISLGLSQSAALNATAAGRREPNNSAEAALEPHRQMPHR